MFSVDCRTLTMLASQIDVNELYGMVFIVPAGTASQPDRSPTKITGSSIDFMLRLITLYQLWKVICMEV